MLKWLDWIEFLICWWLSDDNWCYILWHPGTKCQSEEIHVDALPGNVIAGAGGPAPVVRHQPPGTPLDIYCNYFNNNNDAAGTVVKAALQTAPGSEFEPWYKQRFAFVFYVHKDLNLYIQCLYLVCTMHEPYMHVCTWFIIVNPCMYMVHTCLYTVHLSSSCWMSVHGSSWFILVHQFLLKNIPWGMPSVLACTRLYQL